MKMSREEYQKTYKKASPTSPSLKTVPQAFIAGGFICLLGQAFISLYTDMGISEKKRRHLDKLYIDLHRNTAYRTAYF